MYTIQDGDTGRTVADGLAKNFSDLAAADTALTSRIDTTDKTVTQNKTAADKTQTDLAALQKQVAGMPPRGFKAWDIIKLLPMKDGNSYSAFIHIHTVTYDESTGLYTCNGVSGITEAQMTRMLLYSPRFYHECDYSDWGVCPTNLYRPNFYDMINGRALYWSGGNENGEMVRFHLDPCLWSGKIRYASFSFFNMSNNRTREISEIDVSQCTSVGLWACLRLATLLIRGIKAPMYCTGSPLITLASWQYVIGNAIGGTEAKPVTFHLHADQYAYFTGAKAPTEAVGGTTEAWTQLAADAQAKHISLAQG